MIQNSYGFCYACCNHKTIDAIVANTAYERGEIKFAFDHQAATR